MREEIIIAVLAGAVGAATPILLAALGEILAERSGVLNLGVEGIMLVGAMAGFAATVAAHSLVAGIVAAGIAGASLALAYAILTVTLRANQIVAGLALTIFGMGLSEFLGKPLTMVVPPVTMNPLPVPGFHRIPVIGQVFFTQTLLVYLSYALVPVLWFFLNRTHAGLSLQAVGENPSAADALGVNVVSIRYAAVIVGGVLAGLAGAYLSLVYIRSWTEGLTAGRGWIAIALVIFAGWHPGIAFIGAYLFGIAYVLAFQAQTGAIGRYVSIYLTQMLPYLLAIAVLTVTNRGWRLRGGAPAALTVPYVREIR